MPARRLKNSKPEINFVWNGRKLTGRSGDTLAAALLANDIQLIGRSFKYHRPRSVMSAGVHESGALVTVGSGARRDANIKATTQELYPGLIATSQNAWPSLRCDFGAISNLFSKFLPAGFYYKTFMGPKFISGTGVWMQFEKLIRRAAGMGAATKLPDPDNYEHANAFCDVLVIGAGPAGLAAAAAAAKPGLDVWLVEQDFELGGELLNQSTAELSELTEQIKHIKVLTRTTAFGLYDDGIVGLVERVTDHLSTPNPALPRQRFWTIRPRQIILACGAIEQMIACGNNDRPGVMSVSAGRAYLNRYHILPGESIVIATNNDSAYAAANEFATAGAKVTMLDARPAINKLADMDKFPGKIYFGCAPLNVHGRLRINALDIARRAGDKFQPYKKITCDSLLISGGWAPTIHLHAQRAAPVWNDEFACFVPGDALPNIFTAGAMRAIWHTSACIASGESAGRAAAINLGCNVRHKPMPAAGGWRHPIAKLFEVRAKQKNKFINLKSFVDPQNDVTSDDVRLAAREGFVSVEHLKRYTTLGMATDGGKVGNVIGLSVMADARNLPISEFTPTTFRPPYTPISLGALRGAYTKQHFRPIRRTPMHAWNCKHRATMTIAGLWQRPWYFARSGEKLDDAYIREAKTVRTSVGLCDVTSLGKIAVQGPDAARFLDRVYTNSFAKLPVGKARYGIMLRDDGLVLDDGTTWRLTNTDYFMTTTTAQAAKVMQWIEELLQTRWGELKVHVTSVTDQWAGCAIAGPKSRAVLNACCENPGAVDNNSLPFMGIVETHLHGDIPCRIARISFSGELAYEVYVPSDYATAMMDLLHTAAKKFNGCLYGLEALGTLRIEKGHVTAAELDGRVSIDDVGLGNMASVKKSFVGSALRRRPELLRDDRPKLVGIKPKHNNEKFNAGAILCATDKVSGLGDGWITAVTYSPALNTWIGVGFISGGHAAWENKKVIAADPVRGKYTEVKIVDSHMFDPNGERMHG